MATLSNRDGAVATNTVETKRSLRTELGQLLYQLAKGKKITSLPNNGNANYIRTVQVLYFKDSFYKKMFYRTLAAIALDDKLEDIPMDTKWLMLLYKAFNEQAPIELDDLTRQAIERGSDYTVMYNLLIEIADKKPGYTPLRWLWQPFLEQLSGHIPSLNGKSEDNIHHLAYFIINNGDSKKRLNKKSYRKLLRDIRRVKLAFSKDICLAPRSYLGRERRMGRITGINTYRMDDNPLYKRFRYGLLFEFQAFCKERDIYLRRYINGFFLVWLRSKYPMVYRFHILKTTQKDYNQYLAKYSLSRILKYLPSFMLKDLHSNLIDEHKRSILLHLLEGNNIRTASNLPFPLSKKMAYHFSTLSAGTLETAFYHAFTYGNVRLRDQMIRIWARPNVDFNFLQKVVAFFHRFPVENNLEYQRLLGYIRHQRDENGDQFDLKGRTLISLQRHANTYYEAIERERVELANLERWYWQNNGISLSKTDLIRWGGAKYEEWNQFIDGHWYAIFQLKTAAQLQEESRQLSHCVYSYTRKCIENRCSIWSLRRKEGENWVSLVTIEVALNKRIVQIRSKYNAVPEKEHMDMISEWIKREKLVERSSEAEVW